MTPRTQTLRFDAVVVGTGAGGAPLLSRLARAGLKVLALEAGPVHPLSEMATDERTQEKLFWKDERISSGQDPIGFGRNNSGIGVGGSTLHYTAYVPRVQPDDLKLRTEFGVGQDWPLEYSDLEPYYDELEHFLGISGPEHYPWGPPRNQSYRHAALPLNAAAKAMQRGCAALGIRTSSAPNAALSAPQEQEGYGVRHACTNRGFCQAGCSVGAKASVDVTFLPLAVKGGAEIRPNSFVTRFLLEGNRITGVEYLRDGLLEQVFTDTLFLCAGAIETPRLLLLQNLANSSGQVGRNFMAHVGTQVWGRFEEETQPFMGIPGSLISEDTHRLEGMVGGYLLQSIGAMPVTYASQYARGTGTWGKKLLEHMSGYTKVAGINVLGEGLPYDGNFLELSPELDARGLPKPIIHYSNGDNEKKMAAHAEKLMRDIWTAAGAHDLWTFPRGAHTLGTARMGQDSRSSVINRDCKSWDLENLYICDNSIFPSSLSVNPALTQMALSLRTADVFLEG